jgi:hypothetical protein
MTKERMGQIQDVYLVDGNNNNIGSASNPIKIAGGDSTSLDAFGRWRISTNKTIFDAKLTHTNEPEFWDQQTVSGAGTTANHNPNRASVVMNVSDSISGKIVRQTVARPNYQPGKSQMILMTGIIGGTESGITREIGQFDDENGVFFRNDGGTISVCKKSFASGSAIDTVVNQSDWNIDKMDGTGPSEQVADWTKTQIFLMDYQWLGVGRVRYAIDIDGQICALHEMNHANNLDVAYMSNPNNPLRYSIENDGTGPAASMEAICSAVVSEGGQEGEGEDYYYSTNGTHIDANTANQIYAIIGVRLKLGHKGEAAFIQNVALLTETNDNFEWMVYHNPTVGGVFTYTDSNFGPFQIARGATGNTIADGSDAIAGGFVFQGTTTDKDIDHESGFGEKIDGTRDEYVLAARPLASNADIQGSITLHVNH